MKKNLSPLLAEGESGAPFDPFPSGGGNPVYNQGGRGSPACGAPAPAQEASPDRLISRLGLLLGCALLGYLALRYVFIFAIRSSDAIREFMLASPEGEYLVGAAYSFLCVGVPFLPVLAVLRRDPRLSAPIPLGGVYQRRGALLVVFVALGLCFAANIAANYFASFMESVGLGLESYRQALEGDRVPDTWLGLAVYTVQGAVIPAMVEEFAFRGVALQHLRKFGDWFAILTSAMLFALMHGNMTQVPFALVAGFALGYCATVTGSLWPGILVHFLNNFFALFTSLLRAHLNTGVVSLFTTVCVYGFIGIGALAAVFYVLRNPSWHRLRRGCCAGARRYRFFLAPTMLFSILILTFITLLDISAFAAYFRF